MTKTKKMKFTLHKLEKIYTMYVHDITKYNISQNPYFALFSDSTMGCFPCTPFSYSRPLVKQSRIPKYHTNMIE